MNRNDIIFEVVSTADFGSGPIRLTEGGARHIQLGHRDISRSLHTSVKEVLEKPTEVYEGNTQDSDRLLYLSGNVRSSGGRPLAVVVEKGARFSEVVTATWKQPVPRVALWSSSNDLYTHFDHDHDVLYVSVGPADAAYVEEDPKDDTIWFRHRDSDSAPVGVTVFDVQRKLLTVEDVAGKIARFLGLAETQILDRLQAHLTERSA